MADLNSPAQATCPPDGRLSHGDAVLPCRKSPVEILAHAQTTRLVIQDFCPLAESIEWELGQSYWQQQGSKAFISDAVPVPFAINNDGNLSSNVAEVFFASLVAAESSGSLEPQIFTLELGIGVGLFARYFLDRFRELCTRAGRDYYDRLVYVAGDASERMLLDACRHGIFADHPGRYLLRTVDALRPDQHLAKDLAFAGRRRPFRAMFLNYLLDCLPAAVLQVGEDEVLQLCVRTCVARDAALGDYTDAGPEELIRLASSPDPNERRRLMPAVSVFASEYDYRAVDVERLPYGAFAVQFARSSGSSCVLHNYGAIQCLERLLGLLHEQGFILFNDYRWAQAKKPEDFEHQRFSQATAVGMNFPLVKSYFSDSGKFVWMEPPEEDEHISSRLLSPLPAPEVTARFAERFGKAAYNGRQEYVEAARTRAGQGRFEAAATAYGRALERQPYNWLLMLEAANFLLFTLNSPAAALEMARAALALNPTCSADLWNTYGDCLFSLGRIKESHRAFLQALRVNPADVRARYNLAWVFVRQKDYPAALREIAAGLAQDKAGGYTDRLLQKQAEVLQQLAYRNQQELQRMANRVSTAPPQHRPKHAESVAPKETPVPPSVPQEQQSPSMKS